MFGSHHSVAILRRYQSARGDCDYTTAIPRTASSRGKAKRNEKALGLFAIVLSAWLAHGEIMAEDANEAAVPNLVGTWTGPFKAMREKEVADGSLTLRVLEQDGPLLKAEKSWESMGAAGNVGGMAVKEATESLVGVVDFDGKSVHLAEQDDNGLYMGRLTAPDTLDLVYIEAGHATAGCGSRERSRRSKGQNAP